MWKKGILLVVMFLLLLTGCRTPVEPEAPPSFTLETYPKVDGSTVTIPMSEALVSKLLKLSLEEARLYVLHNKTHEAYLNLIAKNADVIFVTSPSAEEMDLAKKAGVELEVIPVVSEGFVFLVGADNPVNSLTKKQIVEIYSGKITNWKEVGGKDEPILAYQRPVNSGSQTGFLDLVMKDVTPMEAPTTQVIAGMGELIDAVAAFEDQPGGIGYSYFYYTTSMWKNEKVKLISIEGVAPSKETISSSKYPYRTAYYAVVRKDEPKESNARKLVAYILSKEGQNLMEEAGYVKVK